MSLFSQKPARMGISVTCYFDERDAEAVAYDLHGCCEQPANRSDLRSFLRGTVRRALADVRNRYENRASEEQSLIPNKESTR